MSESERPPASDNPYAPSLVGDARAAGTTPGEDQQRTYHVRMSWPARYRFLRSVGPLRLAAMAGAVVGVWALANLMQATIQTTRLRQWDELWGTAFLTRELLRAAQGCLGLYVFWQNWKLAEALAAVAGGKSTSLDEWSVLQLRLARLAVAVIALSAFSLGFEWIMVFVVYPLQRAPVQ